MKRLIIIEILIVLTTFLAGAVIGSAYTIVGYAERSAKERISQ